MSDIQDDAHLFGAIRHILKKHWDPFGAHGASAEEDEYDHQAIVVMEMLRSDKGERQIALYLERAEYDLMGQEPDRAVCQTAAELLTEMYSSYSNLN